MVILFPKAIFLILLIRLLSKQTLLDSSIVNNPNGYNNFYTIPTNIKQSGLYANKSGLYKNQYKVPEHLRRPENLIPYVGASPYINGDYLNKSYVYNKIQDSPNYINQQLIKKLKSLPDNYYLDLCIYLHYYHSVMPNKITYIWTFFNVKADSSIVYHKYKLPILHCHATKKYSNYVNISVFPPSNTPNGVDALSDVKQASGLFSDNTLSWYVPLFGYHLTADNDFLVNNPFMNYSWLPINLQRYTILQNYFKNHRRELLQVKIYAEIAIVIKAIFFIDLFLV